MEGGVARKHDKLLPRPARAKRRGDEQNIKLKRMAPDSSQPCAPL